MPSTFRGDIRFQCAFAFSHINAFYSVLTGKKEAKYIHKEPPNVIDISRLKNDVNRFVKLVSPINDVRKQIIDIIDWKNPVNSSFCAILWTLFILCFQPVTVALVLTMLALISMLYLACKKPSFTEEQPEPEFQQHDESSENMSLLEKLAHLEAFCLSAQSLLSRVDAIGERAKKYEKQLTNLKLNLSI